MCMNRLEMDNDQRPPGQQPSEFADEHITSPASLDRNEALPQLQAYSDCNTSRTIDNVDALAQSEAVDTSTDCPQTQRNEQEQRQPQPQSQLRPQPQSELQSQQYQQCDLIPTKPETSSSARQKPARRRRLAHRRQYTKSRRLASSYLRSQFVRYDSSEADAYGFWKSSSQLFGEHHTSDLKGGQDDGQDNKIEHKFHSTCPTPLDPRQQCLHHDHQLPRACPNLRQRASEATLDTSNTSWNLSESYDGDWSADDAVPIKQMIASQTARDFRTPIKPLTQESQTLTVQDRPIHCACLDHRLADCSSSSLDSSYSPIDHPREREPLCESLPPNRSIARRTLKSTINSTVARSLMSLTHFAHLTGSSDNLTTKASRISSQDHEDVKFKMISRPMLPTPRRSLALNDQLVLTQAQQEIHMTSHRFSTSESVDLTRNRQQPSGDKLHSSNSKFFPPQEKESVSRCRDSGLSDNKRSHFLNRLYESSDNKRATPQQSIDKPFVSQFHSVDRIRFLKHQKENIDCIDNVHFNDLFHGTVNDSSTSITVNQSVRTDPRLHKDDIDIKFSRALNSCKLPQIRYASKERLFERLTDLRFLSIDFLNTFLLTYRVFTTAEDVLESLKSVHYNSERYCSMNANVGLCASEVNYRGTQSQRESFSCCTNSSLMNLSQNQALSSNNRIIEDQVDLNSCRSPNLSPKVSNKIGAQGEPSKKLREKNASVSPPKQSDNTTTPQRIDQQQSTSRLESSDYTDRNDNHLLTPDAHLIQKRRSTISALTPITGSTSSSLVNLTKNSMSKEDSMNDQQPSPNDYNDSLTPSGSHEQSPSDCDENLNRDLLTAFDDNAKRNCLSDSNCSDSNTNVSRQRSSSVCVHVNPASVKPRDNSLWTGRTSTTNSLAVPGRQVRASSLSHVTTTARITLDVTDSKAQIQRTGTEHWRLSYKKSSCEIDKDPSSRGRRSFGNLLTPNILASGDGTAPIRRKSAPDANHIRLEVTLDNDLCEIEKSNHDDAGSSDKLQVCFPSVPPSSPTSDDPTASSSPSKFPDYKTTNAQNRTGIRSIQISPDKLCAIQDDTSVSSIKSNKDRDIPKTSLATTVLLSSSSSSEFSSADDDQLVPTPCATSVKSTSVSSVEIPSDQTNIEKSSFPATETEVPENNHSRKKIDTSFKKRRQSSILKEIDLTQSKLIDSETSADESETKSTDSEAAQDEGYEQNEDIVPVVASIKLEKINCQVAPTRVRNDLRKSDRDHKESLSEVQRHIVQEDSREAIDGQRAELDESRTELSSRARPETDANNDRAGHRGSVSENRGSIGDAPNEDEEKTTDTNAPKSLKYNQTSASCLTTPRSSFQYTAVDSFMVSKAGVVVTSRSPRVSSRRSSTASAASAFAAATAASSNPLLTQPPLLMRQQMNKSPLNDLTCGSTASIDPTQCGCLNLHRASVSSMQPFRKPTHGLPNTWAHQQTCINYQCPTNSSMNIPSDASLCNSRASSRLSSCAGLELSYHTQQHQQSMLANGPVRPQQYSCQHHGSSRASYQSSMTSLGCGHFESSRYASQANIMSKRNSNAHQQNLLQQNNLRSMATLRVLSVMRHWVSKHSQDFVNDTKLASKTQDFLQDLIMDNSLLPAEHKAAIQLQQMLQKAAFSRGNQIDLDILLASPSKPSPDSIETLSALEIAEGMTYLDHKIFQAIKSEEFLGQAWMKSDKGIKAPHILLITKRFNDVSRLVSSEIIRVPELHRRVAIIEKWTNVAHICRVIHNFNGVLQICAAFTNSSVFRLKKTWDKISKTTRATIDQLQNLVSTDSRFRNMRDAINRCDPPSIPYVGMYLTDLSFIEEGTPNYSPEGLLNFSKMRMIAHVIREIQHLQNGVYKMDLNPRVANYLLDASRHLQDDEMYKLSLAIEPRSSGAKNNTQVVSNQINSANHSGSQSSHGKT